MSELRGYDTWKAREPEYPELEGPDIDQEWRCTDCGDFNEAEVLECPCQEVMRSTAADFYDPDDVYVPEWFDGTGGTP